MILFIGAEDKGFFIRETAKIRGEKLNFIEHSPKIDTQINQILQFNSEYMIFDIEQYLDKADVLAEEIRRIQRAKNNTIIIYAAGYDRESKIIKELIFQGLKYFIFSANPGEAKVELERCMQGYYKEEKIEIIVKETEEKKMQSSVKIGITGACNRIGTTTQALQIVKYLQTRGYKACYVQVNNTMYVEYFTQYFNTVHDTYLGKVTFENVDMYYKQEMLLEILNQGYDYYVYDFGTYSNTDFNKTSFLEKDIRIFVMGSKASELKFTDEVLENKYYTDIFYLFNFVSEQEQADILELMEERSERTYFSDYVPDPFIYIPNDMYQKIIKAKKKSEKKVKQPMLSDLFRKKVKRE